MTNEMMAMEESPEWNMKVIKDEDIVFSIYFFAGNNI